MFLDNALDSDKVKEQMDKGSFKVLEYDISESTCIDIQNWLEKWKKRGLSDEWIKFITSNKAPRPGTNYPLIKTHKPDNPARVITSGCGTPTENLSSFVETYCKLTLENIPVNE